VLTVNLPRSCCGEVREVLGMAAEHCKHAGACDSAVFFCMQSLHDVVTCIFGAVQVATAAVNMTLVCTALGGTNTPLYDYSTG
jgi:hypothetical protein